MIQKAADIINRSEKIVAITGAGISTEAGIPDFRSPGTGLWNRIDPMFAFTSLGFKLRPKAFYRLGLELIPPFLTAVPTEAHLFLAKVERLKKSCLIVTQNIDGLHQKAGSRNVVEIHGSLRRGFCIKCRREFSLEEIKYKTEREIPPRCDACRKPIKPDIVLFGDPIPTECFQRAQQALHECDLLLIVGSSLLIYPVADLPGIAVRRGTDIIIVNLEPTLYDRNALVLRGKAGGICRELGGLLK